KGVALVVGHAVEFAQQLGVVGGVVAVGAGVACRVQSGGAADRGHAQARVVGQRRQAGRAGGVARLEKGVLDEGGAGFLGVVHAQLALGDERQAAVGKQPLEFGQFAAVA